MTTRAQYFPLGGGLDTVTPALSVPPGRLIACVNFEPHYSDGYRRIDGFERFDGRPRPHLQTFIGFDLVDATGLTTGTVLTGDTSGATGTVIGISGNSIGVTKVTGTFQAGEDLNTGTYTIDPTSTPTALQAPDTDTEDTFLLAAWDEYRGDITEVNDVTREVRGIWRLRDDTYAWQDDAGGTAGIMYNASSSGWVTTGVTLAHYMKFDAGGGGAQRDLPVVGDTITDGASASATVHRIISWAGSTSGDDATGFIVMTGVTGSWADNADIQLGGNLVATANGASAQFAFSPEGEYRFISHNFFATSGGFRAYGVNGVDDAFEIDPDGVVSPILIPTVDDLVGVSSNNDPPSGKPFLIEEHRNHLFLAFPDGRVVHSSIGQPLNFSAFLSAAEFGLGADVTGLNSVVGGVLVMTTERDTAGLFGTTIADWEKRLIGEQTGGILYTTQKIDTVYGLDSLGITSVTRTDTFGDFAGATVSQLVQPIVNALRSLVNDSAIIRRSNQYRLYFSDNSCLIMYVPAAGSVNEARGTVTPLRVQFGFASYPIEIKRVYNCEDENGVERVFFASDDGYVYEDQVGFNFDGEAIASYIRTAFTHMGSPSHRKRFRRAQLEISANKPLDLKIASDLSYGTSEISSGITDLTTSDVQEIGIFAGGGFWDEDNWDEFFWDGQNVATAVAQLRGTGENVSFLIFNESAVTRPFILQGLTIHYDKRRLQR